MAGRIVIQSKFVKCTVSYKSECLLFSRMEGQAEYNLPPSLETKYVGEMKDGM